MPSRSALQVAFTRIDVHFITWMINSAGRPGMKGTLYWDFTGIAINGHNTWLDAKNGSRSRRDYRKLHIVTAENGIILSYDITHARRHDAPIFEQICGTLPHGSGHVMLDAAYLSRNICALRKDRMNSCNNAKKRCSCTWI